MFKKIRVAVKTAFLAAGAAVGTEVYAAPPTGIDTAITAATTDAMTVGGWVLAALAAVIAIRMMARMLNIL